MPTFALVGPDNLVSRTDINIDPTVKTKAGWKWHEVLETVPPTYDPTTQELGPLEFIFNGTNVSRYWSLRTKTAEEIDRGKVLRINDIDVSIVRIFFNIENRIRTLESRPTLTIAQFKALMANIL